MFDYIHHTFEKKKILLRANDVCRYSAIMCYRFFWNISKPYIIAYPSLVKTFSREKKLMRPGKQET